MRGELLEDLLSRRVDDPVTVRQRARRLGVDLDAAHVLVVLHLPAPAPASAPRSGAPRTRRPAAGWPRSATAT